MTRLTSFREKPLVPLEGPRTTTHFWWDIFQPIRIERGRELAYCGGMRGTGDRQVGGQRAQCTVVVGGYFTLSQRDHENTLSAFFQARMNRFNFFFHIYNKLNYLIHKTFIFPPVKYLFKLTCIMVMLNDSDCCPDMLLYCLSPYRIVSKIL